MEVGDLPFMKNSVVIAAPADRVSAYLDDPSTMVEWLPSMMEIRDVIGTGAGQQYGWTYKYVGLLLNGQSTVIEHVPNELAVHQTIGTINSVWTFKLEPHEEGTTLTLEVEYHIPIPVLGKLAERLVLRRDKRSLDFALANIQEMLATEPPD
jgi:carbon monoxide dehydrogenase subunit G